MVDQDDQIITNSVLAAIQNAATEVRPGMDAFIRRRHPRGFRARDTCYRGLEVTVDNIGVKVIETITLIVNENRRADILRMYRRFTWISGFTVIVSSSIGYLLGGV